MAKQQNDHETKQLFARQSQLPEIGHDPSDFLHQRPDLRV